MPEELRLGESRAISDIVHLVKAGREPLSESARLALAIELSKIVRPELEYLSQAANRHGNSG